MTDWRVTRDGALLTLEREKAPRARAEAARVLMQLGEDGSRSSELAAALPVMLGDSQEEVRRSGVALAARVLAGEELLPLLASRLKDAEAGVRLEAAGQLADLSDPATRGMLAGVLEDPVFEVRFEAARGMAAVKHSAGLDVLIAALDLAPLRFRALGAIAELGDVKALPSVQRLFARWLLPPFEKTQAAGVLASLGDPVGAVYLLERTRSRFGPDRAMAAELCGEVKAPGAFERLSELIAVRGSKLRGAAARGLGRLGDARALPLLAALLEETGADEDLRLDAAEGLCRLQTPEARARVVAVRHTFTTEDARLDLARLLEETP